MVGYTDTVQIPHRFGNAEMRLWSFGPLGLQLWDSIRSLDFLASLPDVDPGELGAVGASGGATQSFLLAAVDDRIQFDAPVNMVSAIMQGGDLCENAPGLRLKAAWRAGSRHAIVPTASSTLTAPALSTGSYGLTWKSKLLTTR
jgi:dienelactone hydrolase